MKPAAERCEAPSPRALAQRERILCAAQECFVRHGFHAASMAEIAETARMSAGLIYRYFENKNAIIQAIIVRQMEEGASAIGQVHSPDELASALLEVFEHWQRGDHADKNAAQFLDVTAAAAREQEIAAVVQAANAQFGLHLREMLRRNAIREGFALDEEALTSRTVLLQSLISGLAVQSIRDPAITRSNLEGALRELISWLMRR